ncbi:MAG: histidine phosphatase family protein [Candidatus Thermoplasmatota archaeon]|nr:histidine phosphatase family protein [Candidatus Thermoplasmatota archaeon]
MPTRLIVMRHAESSWGLDIELDHDRQLSEQGREDTPRMSQCLVELNWQPDLALISSSQRTQETFSLMMDIPSEIRPEIYHAGLDVLLPIATGVAEGETTLILGHNPGCEMLVVALSGEYHPITPASCALFSKDGPNWTLEFVLRPDELD